MRDLWDMASFKNLIVSQLIENYPDNKGFLIAYSGGADSSALLHLFSTAKQLDGKVRAVHINHGINPKADLWQQHCQKTCEDLGVRLNSFKVNLKDTSENSCRLARYDCFKKELLNGEILLTAHHCQDQAETVLMKLVRGSGINGMAGIDSIKEFENGWIARPLLRFSPDQLRHYLIQNKQKWIEDDSNQNNNYRRNYIRNTVISGLQIHWPQVVDSITRTAENLRNSNELLKFYSRFEEKSLSISKLIELPKDLRTSLVYQWLSSKKLPIPNQATLQQITNDFINAAVDKVPKFENQYYQLHRWKSQIYCIKKYSIISKALEFYWDSTNPFKLPNQAGELRYTGNSNKKFIVKFNQTGQKIKLANQEITKSVKKLFQSYNLPIWERQTTPFIYLKGELVSLGHTWSHTKLMEIEYIKNNQQI